MDAKQRSSGIYRSSATLMELEYRGRKGRFTRHPRSDMDGIYPDQVTGSDVRRFLDQAEADVLLVGHTHIPFVLSMPGRGIIANPGAVLRDLPHDEPWIYDPGSQSFLPGTALSRGVRSAYLNCHRSDSRFIAQPMAEKWKSSARPYSKLRRS